MIKKSQELKRPTAKGTQVTNTEIKVLVSNRCYEKIGCITIVVGVISQLVRVFIVVVPMNILNYTSK